MSATGRFEYLLAEYLHECEHGNPGHAIMIVLAMWHRWPGRWHRWVGRHPEELTQEVIGHLHAVGLDEILEPWDDDTENSESVAAGSARRGIGVLKTLRQSQVQAA